MTPVELLEAILEAYFGGETIVYGLLTANTTDWDTVRTNVFVADIAADRSTNHPEIEMSEPDFSISGDAVNERAELDSVDPEWTALPLGDVGDGKIQAVYVALRVTDDDDSPIIKVIDVRSLSESARTPDGTDWAARIGSEGVLHLLPGDA